MSDEPIARKAMREAEAGARADASQLIASVPEMLRVARRIRTEPAAGLRTSRSSRRGRFRAWLP